jgi:hypothetical protein
MDEQLDNELKKRIQEVFENLEDFTADEGWLLLREKFPEEESKRRGLIWFWRGSAAAVLLIFLGIGLWYFEKNGNNATTKNYAHQHVKLNNTPASINPKTKNDSVKYLKQTIKDNRQQIAEVQKTKGNTSQQNTQPDNTQFSDTQRVKSNTVKQSQSSAKQDELQVAGIQKTKNKKENRHGHLIPGSQVNVAENSLAANTLVASKPDKIRGGKNAQHRANQQPGLIDKPIQESLAANEDADSIGKPANKSSAQQFAAITKVDTATVIKTTSKPQPAKKTIDDMFAADKQTTTKKNDKKNSDKRVHFGVYAATYFSYAKGSDQEVNVGAGFSSDIKISNNLKLVTGVAIGQNTLSYSGASSINTAAPLMAAAAEGSKYFLAATPSIKNYNASLVGLDVPMNLKYELNPQKSDTYILAGLSSGTFINQSYTYYYNYPTVNSATLQQTQGATTTKNFDGFYFAKTLNLAFGVGYPLGKNRMVIEPFLKYPLEGLGAQQIRFGAGGINLKFNFSTKK